MVPERVEVLDTIGTGSTIHDSASEILSRRVSWHC
jgi:hypothetical protein